MLTIDDVQFLWLPLAHVFGSVLIAAQLQIGFVTAVDGRVPKIVENLPVVKPTFMGAVPRIFEKVYAGVNAQVAADGGAKAKIASWAFGVGKKYRDAELANGKAPGGMLGAQFGLADKLVFSKVRDRLGGQVRMFISGSAALSPDVAEWFNIVGMPILEGYGLTETSAATAIVRPDNIKFGTVGEAVPGTEVKIAEDGEILVKGPGVMRGYHNKPEATAEVLLATVTSQRATSAKSTRSAGSRSPTARRTSSRRQVESTSRRPRSRVSSRQSVVLPDRWLCTPTTGSSRAH